MVMICRCFIILDVLKMKPKGIAIFIFLFCNSILFSQTLAVAKEDVVDADEHYKHGNYLMAMPIYKNELKKDAKNTKVKYKLGICYLNTRVSRQEAATYLEDASKDPKAEPDVWLQLGRAYHLTNRIDEAIAMFEKYKKINPKEADEADRYIAQCKNAALFMAKPSDVTFQNLGKQINSDEPDYYPFINKDETFLVFTSRRKENFNGKKVEMDGYRSSDIYQSTLENGNWTTAKNVGHGVNGNLDEQVVGMRSDGMEMYVYLDHIDQFGDIYVSSRRDEKTEFAKPRIFEPLINEKVETSGCLSEDGNILFFARRDKMSDNSDLYTCKKLPNGKWAMPQKLPETVNSKYNEDLPYLSYDGNTLYFASDGHNTMGGYDLFKTTWNQHTNTYSKPENLGYPINSTDDDKSICVTEDNRLAYVSSFRPNGFGDLDIYRIKFNNTEPVSMIYTGKVFMGDTVSANQPKNYALSIIVTDASNYEYTFVPNSQTGRFVMSLPSGKYKVTIDAEGFADYKEELTVSDLGMANETKNKNFLLKKK